MSSLDALKAAASKPVKDPEPAVEVPKEAKAAHEVAFDQGIPIAKAKRLKRIILANGQTVLPTPEGYFIAFNAEIAAQLEHYAKLWNYVEIILPIPKELKKEEKK